MVQTFKFPFSKYRQKHGICTPKMMFINDFPWKKDAKI